MKELFFLLAIASILFSCQEKAADPNASAAADTSQMASVDSTSLETLQSSALEETDTLGRLRQSFIALQEEFVKSKGIVPDVGDVTVTVDGTQNLRIENKLNGHTYLTVVKVGDLQYKDNGMMLLPDTGYRKFPGINIKVKPGRPKIQYFKDGKLEKEMDYLEFSLKDRPSMERVVPTLVQAMNIASSPSGGSN